MKQKNKKKSKTQKKMKQQKNQQFFDRDKQIITNC